MVRSGAADAGRLESVLEQIAAQGQRAGQITRHLRRLARRGEQDRVEVDVNALLRATLDLVGNEIKTSSIRLKLELDDMLPSIQCNRIQVEQVVLNLVRNAMDALEVDDPDNRVLTLRSRRTRDSVTVEVEDSGGGFGDTDPERVFETFFTTKPEGVGLGLSISRTIIEDHGGRLWASEGAEGAVFHVSLPVGGSAEA